MGSRLAVSLRGDMLTVTCSLVVLLGDKDSFISPMWEETFVALLACATLLEEPACWVVNGSTHFVAFGALAFQVEFADSLRIRTLLTFPGSSRCSASVTWVLALLILGMFPLAGLASRTDAS